MDRFSPGNPEHLIAYAPEEGRRQLLVGDVMKREIDAREDANRLKCSAGVEFQGQLRTMLGSPVDDRWPRESAEHYAASRAKRGLPPLIG